MMVMAGSRGRKERKWKEKEKKMREGKEVAGVGISSPASRWPEAPAVVVAGWGSATNGGEEEDKEEKGERERKRKEKEKEKEKERD